MAAAPRVHALVLPDSGFGGRGVVGGRGGASARVVAVVGPQASGKSTLANALFGTHFPVAPRGAVGAATTRGIDACCVGGGGAGGRDGAHAGAAKRGGGAVGRNDAGTAAEECGDGREVVVLDVEGADARARGRSGRAFQARAAAFAAGLADVLLLNLWFHDTARVESAGYGLLRAVLAAAARAVVDAAAAEGNVSGADRVRVPRAGLVFVVRDVDDDADDGDVVDVLMRDAAEVWDRVAVSAGLQPGMMALEEVVDVSVVLLPHIRHHAEAWREGVAELRRRLDGDLMEESYSKGVPGEDFAVVAEALWDSLGYGGADVGGDGGGGWSGGDGFLDEGGGASVDGEYYSGEDLVIVAAYRCDDVFSTLLAEASGEVADLHDRVDEGVKVEGLGEVCEKLIAGTLERYEAKASEFADEPVFERKRRELEAILDTGLNAVYLRQLQILREEAIKAFKASLEDELPADYAIFAADASFVSAAKAGQRPASISLWSYASERADLQSMLSEIAAQHRKLVATQVTASEQQSKAIQFLQMQHAQMRAVQQQALGGRTGQWSVGAAYRPPDSNVNVSVGFQQGRTNVQISMVPDESASLLGPNGFTSGVGIGNLGLSFNLNA